MRNSDIAKRTRNSIRARLESCISKHGLAETRSVVTRFFSEEHEKDKLSAQIADAEEKLKGLRGKKIDGK